MIIAHIIHKGDDTMKIEEFCEQLDKMKEAFIEAGKEFGCDEVEIAFKTDKGNLVEINVIEGGYAPKLNTHVLVLSSGKTELEEMLKAMIRGPTVNADDIDVGEKMSMESFLDEDH